MSELETRSATAEDIAEMRQVAEDIVAEMRQKLETCGRKASIGFTVSANAVSVVLSVLISLGGAFLIMFYLRKYLLLLLLHGPGAPAVSGAPSLSTTWRQLYCVRSCPEQVPEVPVGLDSVNYRDEVVEMVGIWCP